MRVPLILGFLLAAGLAVAAPTSVEMQTASCWDCHAPGLWTPPMVEPRISEYRFAPDDGAWFLEADVLNTWTHEMRNVSALLDTSLHGGIEALPMGESTIQTLTGSFPMTPTPMQRFELHTIVVPHEVQSLDIELSSSSMLPHNLLLEVYPPGASEPCPGVQGNRVHFGAEDLAGTGWGEWTLVVTSDPGFEVPQDITYTIDVVMDAAIGAAALIWAGDAGPGEVVTLRWPVNLTDDGQGPLGIRVQYTSYYVHIGSEPDTEFLHSMTGVEVATRNGSPRFTQAPEVDDKKDESIPGIPMAGAGLVLILAALRRRA